MPINYPGTFEVRFFYQTPEPVTISAHELRLSCEMNLTADPGDPFTDWFPLQRDGGAIATLKSHVDSLIALLKPLYHTPVDFINAELWEYTPSSFDAVFRSAYVIAANGTAGTATIDYSQYILTFRSALGGIMKIDLRGTIFTQTARQSFPVANVPTQALATAIVSTTNIWHARDQGYPIAPLFLLPGLNEHAFKEVNR